MGGCERSSAIEHRGDEITKLLRREILSFDRRGETAGPVEDRRLERMRDQSFVGKILNAERVADALDLGRIASQEVPARSAGSLRRSVARQRLRRVVLRVEA